MDSSTQEHGKTHRSLQNHGRKITSRYSIDGDGLITIAEAEERDATAGELLRDKQRGAQLVARHGRQSSAQHHCQIAAYLLEADLDRPFTEAATADVDAVLADEAVPVAADAALARALPVLAGVGVLERRHNVCLQGFWRKRRAWGGERGASKRRRRPQRLGTPGQ